VHPRLASTGIAAIASLVAVNNAHCQPALDLPLRQSTIETPATPAQLTLRDVSRNDRWIGVGARDLRRAVDGSALFFRWHPSPSTKDDPDLDPWYRVDNMARSAQRVPDSLVAMIPAESVSWSADGNFAAWASGGKLFLFDGRSRANARTRLVVAGAQSVRNVRVARDGRAVDFMMGEDLYRVSVNDGTLRRLTRVVRRPQDSRTAAQRWLINHQEELLGAIREQKARERAATEYDRATSVAEPQALPVPDGATVEDVAFTPGRWRGVGGAVRTCESASGQTGHHLRARWWLSAIRASWLDRVRIQSCITLRCAELPRAAGIHRSRF